MRLAGVMPLIVLTILLGGLRNSAAVAASDTSITLQWTAPGDDAKTGQAALYEVRYSRAPITDLNFTSALKVAPFRPSGPGSIEHFKVKGLIPGITYYFAIRTCDERLNWSRISSVAVRAGSSLGGLTTMDAVSMPAMALDFSTPWPNPARTSTHFSLQLPQPDNALIEAFDATGRRVRTLLSGVHPAGRSELVWDLTDNRGQRLGPGLYLVRAQLGTEVRTKRVMVIH